jgi:two-component system sensor histidine kinase DesK
MSLFMSPGAGEQSRWRRVLWVLLGLAYLGAPLGSVLGHGHSAPRVAGGIAALLSFIAAFLTLVVVNNPWTGQVTRLHWITLGVLTAMAIGYPLTFGLEWCGLPIYVGVAYAMALPPAYAPRGVIAAAGMTFVLCLALGAPTGSLVLLSFEALTIGMLMLAFRSSRILVAQLQEARGEVARLAAGEERLRIARDLHDLLGHTLSLIVLKSEVATRIADRDPAKSRAEVEEIEAVARRALAEVREAISGYRRRTLTEELDNARDVLAAAGIEFTIKTHGTPLPDPVDDLFGWSVREGVTNVVRHARARTAVLSVSRQDATAVLEIIDDGVGPCGGSGNGLAGLGERVARAGGTVESGAGPRGGFRLAVRVPVTSPAPAEPAHS